MVVPRGATPSPPRRLSHGCAARGNAVAATATETLFGRPRDAAVDDDPARRSEAEPALRKAVPVARALDAVPLGAFLAAHAGRMVVAWAAFSVSAEATAYALPGLAAEMAEGADMGPFAASWPFGCVLGCAAASVLVDRVGRRATAIACSAASAMLHAAMCRAATLPQVIGLRAAQAAFWALAHSAMCTWYAEFLPTKRRGQLMAVYALGWPLGRGIIILTAKSTGDDWRCILLLGSVGFMVLLSLMGMAFESPRFWLASGNPARAAHVVAAMHARSGLVWSRDTRLCLAEEDEDGKGKLEGSVLARIRALACGHTRNFAFSATLFAALSFTTVLLDTWGPLMFQQLLSPGSDRLPHVALLLFNVGDLAGIVVSIALADRLGRRGSFMVGFFLQGALFGCMLFAPSSAWVILWGTLASSCRCFGWEAAGMWTAEAFPTDLRAMALSFTLTSSRILQVVVLNISGKFVGAMPPRQCLAIFSATLCIAGVVVVPMFPKETANVPIAEGRY